MAPPKPLPQSKREENIRQSPAEGHMMDMTGTYLARPPAQAKVTETRGSGACRRQRSPGIHDGGCHVGSPVGNEEAG